MKIEFYDIAPRIFSMIRKLYNIHDDDYLKSIGPEQLIGSLLMGKLTSLSEQMSRGKSGSYFYYTPNGRFIMKSIEEREFKMIVKILEEYYAHLRKYPHTFMIKFLGLHKI